MLNLAGHLAPNFTIERELIRCRIEVIRGETSRGEVATSLTGRLGPYTFRRAWRYWVANGRVPLAVADELYDDPVGVTDIRVNGNCLCPDPRDGAEYYDPDGVRLLDMTNREECERYLVSGSQVMKESAARVLAENRFVEDPAAVGNGFIDLYHIDSEIGLRVFADAIRRHGLDGQREQPSGTHS